MQELISIIVPVYKVELFLNQAVESLIKQTYSHIEIILVDDGSPDNCGRMCDEWAKRDCRVRVIHQENAGLSMARNAGIESSRGAYLMFVDSDDFVEPAYVETLYHAVVQSKADMAVSGVSYLNADGSCTTMEVATAEQETVDGVGAMILLEGGGSVRDAYTVVWNKIYRRELWEQIRFPKGKVYEDAFVMPSLFYSCQKVVLLKQCLYWYRKREGSITAEQKERYAHVFLEMMTERERFYEQTGIKELKVLHQIHLYWTRDYLQKQTKQTRRQIQRKLRGYYVKGSYTTRLSFGRRVKNFVAAVSLPLYHKLVKLL